MTLIIDNRTRRQTTTCLQFKIAQTHRDILRCQALVSEVYYQRLGITFHHSHADPDAKIELFPHRYLMGIIEDQLIATMGLYLHSTNPERYGNTTAAEIDQLLAQAGAQPHYSGQSIRELSKFIVIEQWRNRGIGKLLMGAAHSQDFIHLEENSKSLLVACANQSIFKYFSDVLGIRTRFIKSVPTFKIHEFYRAGQEPMENRLTIPDLDIPSRYYKQHLPQTHYV